MGAEKAIDYNFQYFYIDKYETGIYNEVKNGGNWAGRHFGLTERHFQHDHPSCALLIGPVFRSAEVDVSGNPTNIPIEKIGRR